MQQNIPGFRKKVCVIGFKFVLYNAQTDADLRITHVGSIKVIEPFQYPDTVSLRGAKKVSKVGNKIRTYS